MSTGPFCASGCRVLLCGVRKLGSVSAFTALLVLAISFITHAQGGVPLQTVVTDQSQLNLSPDFGVPAATAIDQKGDFAFIGEGDSALFVRASGASSVTRLLQNGDAVPGVSGSTITGFVQSIFESQAGVLFAVDYSLADGAPHQAVLVWSSGTMYSTVATDTTTAPGTNGLTYGVNLVPEGINDSGDLAFTAVPSPAQVTLFIAPAGGAAKRVIGIGDAVQDPSVPNETFSALLISPGLNALGELVFLAEPTDAVYIASKGGQITEVANPSLPAGAAGGGCLSGGDIANLARPAINNSGAIAFEESTPPTLGSGSQDAICYTATGSAPVEAIYTGQSAPSAIGGTVGTIGEGTVSPTGGIFTVSTTGLPLTLDDSGDILAGAQIAGSSTTTYALLRFSASTGQLASIAYSGESDPAGTSKTVLNLEAFSMASDGTCTFLATLDPGAIAIYQQTGTTAPVLIAAQGASLPAAIGGTLDLSEISSTQTLSSHAVFLSPMIDGGSAYSAEVLDSAGSIQSLVSTADALPAAPSVQLSALNPASGSFVGFSARYSGGRSSLFVDDLGSDATTKIVTEGDSAPGTGGVIAAFRIPEITEISAGGGIANVSYAPLANSPAPPVPFYLNAQGQIAFDATVAGGSGYTAIFTSSRSGPLTKVVAAGDVILEFGLVGSSPVSAVLTLSSAVRPINDSGQIAFEAIAGSATAVFRYNPDGTIATILPPGPQVEFPLIGGGEATLALNDSGEVAFEDFDATTYGFYADDGTTAPQPVALEGDTISGTNNTLNEVLETGGLSDNGALSFIGAEPPVLPPTFLIGTGTAPDANGPTAVAVNAGAAPGGGTFLLQIPVGDSDAVFFPASVENNAENDLVLFSQLSGAASNSAYFISYGTGSNAGVLQRLVYQGESIPTGGTLNTIPAPDEPGSGFALGPDGELLFADSFTNGNTTASGLFLARQDGSLTKVLAAGDAVPGGGSATNFAIAPGLAGGAPGTFAFWASISGGSAHQAIFATQIPSGTAASTTAVTSSLTPSPLDQSVTLTATVTSSTQGTPTGTVTFFDSGVALGQPVALTSATATFATSSLAAGSHSITAQYSGDTTFAPSTSAVFMQVVQGAQDFSVSASPSSLSIVAGQSGQITITVTPINGSTQTVTFNCGGLPAMTTCQANPSSITLDGTHQASSVITIQTTASSAIPPATNLDRNAPPSFPIAQSLEITIGVLALLGAIPFCAKRRFAAVALCTAVATVCLIAGCGGGNSGGNPGGSGGTPAGTYSITLTIAAGASSHTALASVTVTK